MTICASRGPLSQELLSALTVSSGAADGRLVDVAREAVRRSAGVLDDDDLQLSLYLMYELHYGGLDGVDDRWEWCPPLLAARAVLEDAFEAELRAQFPVPTPSPQPVDVPALLFQLAAEDAGPPGGGVASFVAREATAEQVAELLAMRSAYQLKEADPQTWGIPRLSGATKAALVEIQIDEYGGGTYGRMHAQLFARSMRCLGLSDVPNAYLDHVPAPSLASVNAMTMFGLHRRWRGAMCGLLAAFEMTSSPPCRRYASGLERLGFGEDATEFFDEHVTADALHEQLAAHDLCGSLLKEEPALVDDVLLGALVCHGLDARVGERTMTAFREGRSPLRIPLRGARGRAKAPHAAA